MQELAEDQSLVEPVTNSVIRYMLDSTYRKLLALLMTDDSPLNPNVTASGVPKSWLEWLVSLLRLIVFSVGSLYDNGCEIQES